MDLGSQFVYQTPVDIPQVRDRNSVPIKIPAIVVGGLVRTPVMKCASICGVSPPPPIAGNQPERPEDGFRGREQLHRLRTATVVPLAHLGRRGDTTGRRTAPGRQLRTGRTRHNLPFDVAGFELDTDPVAPRAGYGWGHRRALYIDGAEVEPLQVVWRLIPPCRFACWYTQLRRRRSGRGAIANR